MLWQKIHNSLASFKNLKDKKYMPFLLMVFFAIAFFSTRLPRLANDIINPDAVLWHIRSEQFVVGLKYGQFEKTYQHYHPGVTLMWIIGSSVEVFKQITGINVYTSETYMSFDLVAKSALVLVQFILTLLIILNLAKLTGFYKSFLVTSIFTFEPFFLGNSRILHLDVLSTLLVLLALVFLFQNLQKPKLIRSVLVGLFLALAFLTKSICIGAFIYGLFYSVFYLLLLKDKKNIVKVVVPMFISFIAFTFLFFPALWGDPKYYMIDMIFKEGQRVGMEDGHRQVLMGELTNNGGVFFYLLIFLIKSSPFMLLGVLLSVYYYIKKSLKPVLKSPKKILNKFTGFGLYLCIFYLGYILFMTVASKKIDRYLIMLFPFFAYTSYYGYKNLLYTAKKVGYVKYYKVVMTFLVFIFILIPTFRIFPWYFTYVSPVIGNTVRANKIIGQKSFGVGIPDLKKTILQRYYNMYGEEPLLGFYDTQPMRAIYPNSKIFDVRVYGPGNYDLLVLTMNESMPDKVLNDPKYELKKDYSIYINGLEYWRIYIKFPLRDTVNGKE